MRDRDLEERISLRQAAPDISGIANNREKEDFVNYLKGVASGQMPDFDRMYEAKEQIYTPPEMPKKEFNFKNVVGVLLDTLANAGTYAQDEPYGAALVKGSAKSLENAKAAHAKKYENKGKLVGDLEKVADDYRKHDFETKKFDLEKEKAAADIYSKRILNDLHRAQADATRAETQGGGKNKFQNEANLRQQFLNVNKDYGVIENGYSKVLSAAENPSPANDISLLFGYMKMLDPTSVVRESEYATAENAAGVPEQIRQRWNKALSGEALSEDMRADFVNAAQNVYRSQKIKHDSTVDEYRRLAENYGLSPENIAIEFKSSIGESEQKKKAEIDNLQSDISKMISLGNSPELIRDYLESKKIPKNVLDQLKYE